MIPSTLFLKIPEIVMESRFIIYKNSRVCFRTFGSGDRVVVCFHGYGEDGAVFSFLEKYIGGDIKLHALDLPFHGKTEWKVGLNCSNMDLLNLLKEIPIGENSKIILMGFSLGGRIALSLYERIPERIEKMILLAPDGLTVNFWYWFATQTVLGNKLFSFTMKRSKWFFTLLKIFNKTGLVNASIYKFVNHYIGNKEARNQLYNRWTAFRKIKPSLKKIKIKIRLYKTPVRLMYGKFDRIILPENGRKFQKGIEEYCSIQIISSGHQVLQESHIKEILCALQTTAGND